MFARMKTTLVMVGIASAAALVGYLAHDYVHLKMS